MLGFAIRATFTNVSSSVIFAMMKSDLGLAKHARFNCNGLASLFHAILLIMSFISSLSNNSDSGSI